jgi:hypothetical protein
MTNNQQELIVGNTYFLRTANYKAVTYLGPSSTPGRGLFLSDQFSPTPFISWGYNIVSPDSIDAHNGNYYFTLSDMVKGELK